MGVFEIEIRTLRGNQRSFKTAWQLTKHMPCLKVKDWPLTFDPLGSNTKGVCAQPYKGVLWLGKNERAAYVCRERSNYLFDRPICGGIDNVASKANCKHISYSPPGSDNICWIFQQYIGLCSGFGKNKITFFQSVVTHTAYFMQPLQYTLFQ